jgi:hypothetical protein
MLKLSHRLALFTPLLGMINLFIYVLKYPTLPTTHSDIALMDVAVGHFGRLEFASSDLAFPFTRDAANIARVMARKIRESPPAGNAPSPALGHLTEQPARLDTALDSIDDVSFYGFTSPLLTISSSPTYLFTTKIFCSLKTLR